MLEMIILILMMYVIFKVAGFFFGIVGKLLGCVFGIIGYILLGVFYVAVFGMAVTFLPVLLILGAAGIMALMAKPA